MPSGIIHAAITTVAAGGLYWGLSQAGYPDHTTMAAAAGCMAGILLTPDLDVDNPTRSHYVVYRKFGAAPFLVWLAIWYPYGKAIGHRSWLSHGPIISTIIRLLYLSIFVLLLAQIPPLVGYKMPWDQWLTYQTKTLAMVAILGLMVSDTLHWAADNVSTGIKRKMHRRQQGRRQQQGVE